MTEKEPTIIFERKVVESSGTLRIAIPGELARALAIEKGESLEMFLRGRTIVMQKKE